MDGIVRYNVTVHFRNTDGKSLSANLVTDHPFPKKAETGDIYWIDQNNVIKAFNQNAYSHYVATPIKTK